jgi:hypothetical protein
MWPAVLITLGVLFLLDQMGHAHWMEFDFTWPALLIVIGLIMLLQHGASIYGHIPREYNVTQAPYPGQPMPPGTPGYPGYPPQAQAPMQPQAPIVTPPSGAPAGFITPDSPVVRPDDKEVPNG